jgi:hypothetical protein
MTSCSSTTEERAVCDAGDEAGLAPVQAWPADAEWTGEVLPLELHAVIGGFHLQFEPVIADTVTGLGQLAPDVIVPAHCTGWKATHAIARRLPAAFIQNSVGTTFHLTAAATA